MKIYILQWLDSDADFCAQREAFYNRRDAKKKHAQLVKNAITDMDLTIGAFEEDCRECNVTDKESLVDLINSFL